MADIDHPVQYVAQSQPMSCWAASAAMMMGKSEAEILEQFAAFGDDGADEPECRTLAEKLNMTILPEACRNADGWWQILGRAPAPGPVRVPPTTELTLLPMLLVNRMPPVARVLPFRLS